MKQAIYGMTATGIIAAAGLVTGAQEVWVFAALTAGLAFVTEELRNMAEVFPRAGVLYGGLALGTALASWATASIAFLALVN
jgi:hypothetical protein